VYFLVSQGLSSIDRLAPTSLTVEPAGMAPLLATTTVEDAMLYTLAVILLIAWLLGVVGTYTIGAFVHMLLVVAVVLFLVGIIQGNRTVV
jgi:Family of unknown function (DUF5670)